MLRIVTCPCSAFTVFVYRLALVKMSVFKREYGRLAATKPAQLDACIVRKR